MWNETNRTLMMTTMMTTTIADNNDDNDVDVCSTDADDESSRVSLTVRYWMVGVFGGSVCSFGIISNVVLLQILLKPNLRSGYLLYCSALSLMDINVAVAYLLVMSVDVFYQRHNWYILYRLWFTYIRYFYALTRVVTFASTYLVVACTAERYLEVLQLQHRMLAVRLTHGRRCSVILAVIALSVAFRLVVFWELVVLEDERCNDTFAYYALNRSHLIADYYYSKVYSFYVVHIVQVFLPFVLLLLLNLLIIDRWRDVVIRLAVDHHRRGDDTAADADLRKKIKLAQSARQMMVAIVSSYFVCNLLNLILTFWEHINYEFLRRHSDFYAFASDVVTLLTVVNASLRLPIYYFTNVRIRTEIRRLWIGPYRPPNGVYRTVKGSDDLAVHSSSPVQPSSSSSSSSKDDNRKGRWSKSVANGHSTVGETKTPENQPLYSSNSGLENGAFLVQYGLGAAYI